MPTVKYMDTDPDARTVTFDVDGLEVVRSVPEQFEGTLDEYIEALARGLLIEYSSDDIKEITETTYKSGEAVATDAVTAE